jgi:hypothetical protein
VRAGARVSLVGAPILAGALLLSSCGGRVPLAATTGGHVTKMAAGAGAGVTSTTDAAAGNGASANAASPTASADRSTSTTQPTTPHQVASVGNSTDPNEPILKSYEDYLADLSALDDTLNREAIGPLATVTTTRLAQASVREAAALLAAHEHGVGTLHDDQVKVVMTGPASASLVDCQDEQHFYLVANGTGTTDTFVARGYFVGSAQMLLQQGRWLVDVFTTTHVTCAY